VSEFILERSLQAPGSDGRTGRSFDFDRRAFVLRVILSACLGASSVIISVMVWNTATIVLLLSIALPLTIVVAWFSALRLRMPPPIIVLDRNGIWDRRLGVAPIPWRRIRRIELDRDTDILLDVGSEFQPDVIEAQEPFPEYFPLGSGRELGKIRIRLDEIGTTLPEFLAAMDAMLPHDKQAPVCPAILPRRPDQFVRPVFAGVVTGIMAALLIAGYGATRDDVAIYRELGAAKDLGVQPGESSGTGLVRFGAAFVAGISDERVRLGHMYHAGYGVAQDDIRAAQQFGLAAADGVAAAQAAMGFLRENGIGIPQDFIEALNWYRKAADQGDAWARTRLALMYRDGRGVPRDQEHAFELFVSAAQQGDASAQYFLGEAFENGWGVAENSDAALKSYGEAAAQGHERAEYRLGVLYSDGRSVQRDEAQAFSWFQRSAKKGYAPAQYALGLAFELGLGVSADPNQAVLWYSLAEWHGQPAAKYRREQFLRSLSQSGRQAALTYRQRWLRESFLLGEAVTKFREYRGSRGPKAFAASLNGGWAIVEGARDQGDAARAAMKSCGRSGQVCLLFALGDEVVVDMGEPRVERLLAHGLQNPAR